MESCYNSAQLLNEQPIIWISEFHDSLQFNQRRSHGPLKGWTWKNICTFRRNRCKSNQTLSASAAQLHFVHWPSIGSSWIQRCQVFVFVTIASFLEKSPAHSINLLIGSSEPAEVSDATCNPFCYSGNTTHSWLGCSNLRLVVSTIKSFGTSWKQSSLLVHLLTSGAVASSYLQFGCSQDYYFA